MALRCSIPSDLELGKVPATLNLHRHLDGVKAIYTGQPALLGVRHLRLGLRRTSTPAPLLTPKARKLSANECDRAYSAGNWPDHIVAPLASGSLFARSARDSMNSSKWGWSIEKPVRSSGARLIRLLTDRPGVCRGRDYMHSCETEHDRQVRLRSASRYERPLCLDIARAATARSPRSAMTRIRVPASSSGLETEGVFHRTGRWHHIAVLKKLVEQGKIDPSETTSLITGNGLKPSKRSARWWESLTHRAPAASLQRGPWERAPVVAAKPSCGAQWASEPKPKGRFSRPPTQPFSKPLSQPPSAPHWASLFLPPSHTHPGSDPHPPGVGGSSRNSPPIKPVSTWTQHGG